MTAARCGARRRAGEDRYYLDDPEDMARLRRDRAARYRIAPPIEEYEDAPREIFPDEDGFPEAPRRGFRDVPEEEPETRDARPGRARAARRCA